MTETPTKTLRSDNGTETADNRASSESLTRRAFVEIRDDIVSGELKPGSKLKIEALRQRYALGASPIREALSLLTSTSLVERLDQRGFRVAPISLKDFDELLWTRCKLEAIALQDAIENSDANWEEDVVLAHHRLARLPGPDGAGPPSEEWQDMHKVFHMTLISGCGSRYLRDACSELYDHNMRYRRVAENEAMAQRNVKAEHAAITDAVVARDSARAVQLLEKHYRATGAFLRRAMGADE